jgi:hypothetical protein
MEASGPDNGEKRARNTGILIGVLVAAVVGLGVALALVLAGGDDDKDKTQPATTPTLPTQTTQPTDTTVTTTPPTTTTTPPSTPTIDQTQAKAAAQRGAAAAVTRFGISIPPPDWDARCTAAGGTDQAATWSCQVASNGGQCSGSITAFATAAGVAATRNAQVGCGE